MLFAFCRTTDRSSLSSSSFVSQVTSDTLLREFRAQDTRLDLGESSVTARGSVITERRETAVVGSAQLLHRYLLRGFKYTVSHFFRGLNMGVDRSSDSHKNPPIRFPIFSNDFQRVPAVPLTRQRDVEIYRLQLQQDGQPVSVIDIRRVRQIELIY